MPGKPTKPTPKKERQRWRPKFLATLAECGVVSTACTVARVHRSVPYHYRKLNAEFATAWDDAVETAVDAMEAEAHRRAVVGVEKPVYQGGKKIGTIREYSDVLLIFLLKANRPEKYRDNFDLKQLVAQLALRNQPDVAPANGATR